MIIWIDAQLSPALAHWLHREFEIQAFSVRRLDLFAAGEKLVEITDLGGAAPSRAT